MNADLSFAFELADAAGAIAMARFGADDLVVESKDDGSPVTSADREIEQMLRRRIETGRPGHAITGEEFGETPGSEWRWYLDPIDGTASYIAGNDDWKILITLVRRDRLELAVVDSPILGERWWAVRGGGAYRNGERLQVSSTAPLARATVGDDWRHTLANGVTRHPLARIAARCRRVRPHTGHGFLLLAAGEIDVAAAVGGLAWDYAPMMLIVDEAGGRFTDMAGRSSFDSGTALVTNGAIHDEVLALLTDDDD